jgi:type II secretory pathway pseudopilin PulG
MKYYNVKARQAGMTLIELTVVLLVLIGLAGLMIPYVSGFLSKTHDSTGTNNLARLNGNFARFQNEYMRYPDNLESLVDTSGSDIYSKLMNPGLLGTVAVNNDSSVAMSDARRIRVMSLNRAGIQTVLDNDASTDNATFNSVSPTPVDLTTTTSDKNLAQVCGLDNNPMMGTTCDGGTDPADIANHLAKAFGGQASDYDTTCFDYIAFGVGDGTEMIGRTMNSAPVHFASNGDMGPANKYNRFIAVFKVDKDNTTAGCSTNTEPAKFIGSAMLMMQNHLWGVGHTLGHAYENIANN